VDFPRQRYVYCVRKNISEQYRTPSELKGFWFIHANPQRRPTPKRLRWQQRHTLSGAQTQRRRRVQEPSQRWNLKWLADGAGRVVRPCFVIDGGVSRRMMDIWVLWQSEPEHRGRGPFADFRMMRVEPLQIVIHAAPVQRVEFPSETFRNRSVFPQSVNLSNIFKLNNILLIFGECLWKKKNVKWSLIIKWWHTTGGGPSVTNYFY